MMMINNIIKVKCCKCGKVVTVKVNTITKLQNRLHVLEEENKTLRAKLAAAKVMNDKVGNTFKDFNNFFGGA